MIVAVLLCVIGIFSWCQPSTARRITAGLFAAPTLVFALVSGWFDDEWYYLGAALTDSLTIILLSSLVAVDRLVIRLMVLSAISMSLNFTGLAMYEMYQPSTLYDALFITLYVGVIIALADQEGSNVGISRADRLRARYLRDDGASARISHQGD